MLEHAADAELDVVAIGSAMVEITPARMGRSLEDVEEMRPLPSGSAANFAGALAALDTRVGLISRVGADELGRWLTSRLGRLGVDTRFIKSVEGQLTPISFAWMDQEGEKTFYFYRFPGHCDPMGTLGESDIERSEAIAGRIFDFTEAAMRNEPLRSAALRAARIAKEVGRTVCYAVNYRPSAWCGQSENEIIQTQENACSHADIAIMNHEEATLVSSTDDPERQLHRIADLGPTTVIISRGEQGAHMLDRGTVYDVHARDVEVLYDIGAGDSFHAGFIAGLISGMNVSEAARFASDAAALRISRPAGAPHPGFDEVRRLSAERA